MARARKAWGDYSPAYRARLSRHGITEKNYRDISRSGARGHGRTPEHPSEARRHPERYPEYVAKRQHTTRGGPSLTAKVIARKERNYETRHKFVPKNSAKYVRVNPLTKRPPDPRYMAKYLSLSEDEFEEYVDWTDPEWGFLFYH